jgi:Protein of unknown function (DUF3592)
LPQLTVVRQVNFLEQGIDMNQLSDFLSELSPYMPLLVFLAVVCLIGIIMITRSYATLRDSMERRHWPRIQAKVIRYEISTYTVSQGQGSSVTRYAYSTISSYEIQDQFYFNESEALQRCPIGQWVELIYNPEDPQQSRLSTEMGWLWSSFRGIWLGVALFSIGAGFLLVAILFIHSMPSERIFYTAKFSLIIVGICIVVIFSCRPLATIFVAIRKGARKMMMSQK